MVAPLELLLEHACALCRSLARVQSRLTSCTGVGALRKALAGARAQVAGAVGKRRRAFTSVQACTPAPARACLRAGHRLRRGVQQERVTTTPLRVQAVQSAEVRRLGPCAHSCAFVRRVSRSSLVLCCRPLPQRPVSLPTPQQKLQQAGGQVVQLYRYPGLSSSKAKTLLRKAHDKVSPKLVAIDGELVRRHALHTSNWRSAQGALLTCSRAPPPWLHEPCVNVSSTEPLTAEEAGTLAWLLRETYEPEMLMPATKFGALGPTDAVVEVRRRAAHSGSYWYSALPAPAGMLLKSLIVDSDAHTRAEDHPCGDLTEPRQRCCLRAPAPRLGPCSPLLIVCATHPGAGGASHELQHGLVCQCGVHLPVLWPGQGEPRRD